MPTYRAYTLSTEGRITWGEWIEAEDLQDAREKAHALCDGDHPTVELWEGVKKLGEVDCGENLTPSAKGRRS